MNSLNDLLQQPMVVRLGWTLIHFLWQGSVIALAVAVVQSALKRHSAQARYVAGCGGLAAMLVAFVVTFAVLGDDPTANPSFTATPGSTVPAGAALPNSWNAPTAGWELSSGGVTAATEAALPWLVLGWIAGVISLSIHLVGGWLKIQRLKTQGIELRQEPWLDMLGGLRHRLAVTRPVRLLQSALVEVPTVIGWLRPVILLPVTVLTGVTPEQLEAILAHELAHIRRNDYLVNLAQRAVEILLFYHPAVWWVSRRIREEREHCCDDLVVQVGTDRVGYARALASLEVLRSTADTLALAADGGSLGQRIRRLLRLPSDQPGIKWHRIAFLILVATGAGALALGLKIAYSPPLFSSEVKIILRRVIDARDAHVAQTEAFDADWTETEVARILSPTTLGPVIDKLSLTNSFTSQTGTPLDKSAVYHLLRKNISVILVPNSSILRLKVRRENPTTAEQLANTIAQTYLDHRKNLGAGPSGQSIGVLKQELELQQEQLAAAEEKLVELRTELGIPFKAGDALPLQHEAETARMFERAQAEAQIKLANFESLLTQLTNKPREELAGAIAKLHYRDSRIEELQTQLEMAETSRDQLTQEFGEGHPKVKSVTGVIKELGRQLDNRVDGILAQIEIEVSRNRAQLEFLTTKVSEFRRTETEYQPYLAAKRDHDTKMRICETIKLLLEQKAVDTRPAQFGPQIIQPATPPVREWF